MKKNSLYGAVDFTYALLEGYKALNLNENDLAVILMVEHLLKQGNSMVTADVLSLKMSLKIKDIDATLGGLLRRGLISYKANEEGLSINLDVLKEKLYEDLAKRLEKEQVTQMDAKRMEELSKMGAFFEEKLDRGLSPIEQSTLQEWFIAGYKPDEIKNAVLDCLGEGIRNFNGFQKALRRNRRKQDVAKEGNSMVSSTYDKDITQTMKAARELFGED